MYQLGGGGGGGGETDTTEFSSNIMLVYGINWDLDLYD